MSEAHYIIHHFCWYSNEKENSDKVWGWCEVEGKIYNFWGRRGKNLQFKRHTSGNDIWTDAQDLCFIKSREKIQKGYTNVNVDNIESVYPDFHKEFKKQLFTARLTGKVRDEDN